MGLIYYSNPGKLSFRRRLELKTPGFLRGFSLLFIRARLAKVAGFRIA
jgi:hypothetical protein